MTQDREREATPPMTDREQDREAFEKWARQISPFHIFERYSERIEFYAHMHGREVGDYTSEWTHYAWLAWQAATAAAVPPGHVVVPELVRDFVQDFADEPCSYNDGCPPTARHYRCNNCKARDAFAAAEGK